MPPWNCSSGLCHPPPPPIPQSRGRKRVVPRRCPQEWKHKAEGSGGASGAGSREALPGRRPLPGVCFGPGGAIGLRSGRRRRAVVTAPGRAVERTVWLHLPAGQVPRSQQAGPWGSPGPLFLSPRCLLCLCAFLSVCLSVRLSLSSSLPFISF